MTSYLRHSTVLLILTSIFTLPVENIYALGKGCEAQASVQKFHGIPHDRQMIIRDTLVQLEGILGSHLKMPKNLRFELNPDAKHFGFSYIGRGMIELPASAMKISFSSFRTLIAHEVTHQIVVHNFRGTGSQSDLTLFEIIKKFGEESDFTFHAMRPHWPMAELLCDVMAILVMRDPLAISRLIGEMIDQAPSPHKEKAIADFGLPLQSRDFSISAWDPRWKDFETDDEIYGRYNQLRAYLWESHMQNLVVNLRPEFFARLFAVTEDFYKSADNFERAYASDSLSEVNRQVMTLLDGHLWGSQMSRR